MFPLWEVISKTGEAEKEPELRFRSNHVNLFRVVGEEGIRDFPLSLQLCQ